MEVRQRVGEEVGVRGTITLRNFLLESPRAKAIDEYLTTVRGIPEQIYSSLLNELAAICQTRKLVVRNQVLLAARTEMAKRMVGDADYTGQVNYGALGTGSTAVADIDTVLDTEVARGLVATSIQTGDSVTFDFYFSKSSTNGTYEEFGLFIDGTASVDSGLLFNRALTGGWTKTSLEAMTVSATINFNAS